MLYHQILRASPLYQRLSPVIVINPVLCPLWFTAGLAVVLCPVFFPDGKGKRGEQDCTRTLSLLPTQFRVQQISDHQQLFQHLSRASCKHTLTDTHSNIQALYFYNIKVVIKMPTFPVHKRFRGCINIPTDDRLWKDDKAH